MRCLFFDIDGTLIDYPHGLLEIPSGVRRELARIRALGHRTLIATGRPRSMVEAGLIEGFDGAVLAGGAHVVVEDETVFARTLDADAVREVADVLDCLGCPYLVECETQTYCAPASQALYDFFDRYGRARAFVRAFDRDEVLGRALKLEINVSEEQHDAVSAALGGRFKTIVASNVHDSAYSFELYDPAVSKADGIERALKVLGATREDAVAFGDGAIDREMLAWCGLGVAMGNADEELKQVADLVCGPVLAGGLEHALAELF